MEGFHGRIEEEEEEEGCNGITITTHGPGPGGGSLRRRGQAAAQGKGAACLADLALLQRQKVAQVEVTYVPRDALLQRPVPLPVPGGGRGGGYRVWRLGFS